ncbi:NapC/NirT family cytochrome c [Magnetovibrio sp. PR-2]|uniref:NapC/NirT family cytochrome c n=1 Tax=Magnetovibrio sp. PR-2 TaxID=3120356 RepID=UPI002FCE0A6D
MKSFWKLSSVWMVVVGVIILGGASYGGIEVYTAQSSFCGGSCHVMDEQDAAWKNSKHHASNSKDGTQAECVDCHFGPEGHGTFKAKMEGLRHLAAYLYDPNAPLPIRPVVKDENCTQCHAKEDFQDKELQFSDKKVRFKHKVHFSEKALEGQDVACEDCHFKTTAEKHFEVPQEICFLCHLKLDKPTLEKAVVASTPAEGIKRISFKTDPRVEFNEGKSKCSICHTIPTKPLQAQLSEDDPNATPITHQTLQERGVPCESCHFDVVKGDGHVETGNVVSNGCLKCHNRSEKLLSTAQDKVKMHDTHIPTRTADCFDCHVKVEHKNQPDHYDFVRNDCQLCHQDQHKFQKILLTGAPVFEGSKGAPQLMDRVNTNCMACHVKKKMGKGHPVRTGSGEACVACHTKNHKKMLENWGLDVERNIKDVTEVAAEAQQALIMAVDAGADPKVVAEAKDLISKGQQLVDVVRIGNGVHNKKYSIKIIDDAFANFEDAIDLLSGG